MPERRSIRANMRERPPSTGGGTLVRLSTAAPLNRGRAILTISASSATLIRRTFFSRHPARLGWAARDGSVLAAGEYAVRERRATTTTTTTTAAAAAAAAPDAEGWTDRKLKVTSYTNKLFASTLIDGCGDGGGRRRERREGPAESEGDSPRTLPQAELFSASIRFRRRRNMRAAAPPTAHPCDSSDGGGPKNRTVSPAKAAEPRPKTSWRWRVTIGRLIPRIRYWYQGGEEKQESPMNYSLKRIIRR